MHATKNLDLTQINYEAPVDLTTGVRKYTKYLCVDLKQLHLILKVRCHMQNNRPVSDVVTL